MLRGLHVVLALAVGSSACGGGGAATTPSEPITGGQQGVTFASLRLSPPAASVPLGGTIQLTAIPLDDSGKVIAGLPGATFASGAPAVATVDETGLVTGTGAGMTGITASLTANGETRTATSAITVAGSPPSPPSSATVTTPSRTYNPDTVRIATGGTVTWQIIEENHTVNFLNAEPPGGDVPDTEEGTAVSRTFLTAGTYEFRCERHWEKGMRGAVIVETVAGSAYTALELTPSSTSVRPGGTMPLRATPLDQYGSPMSGLPAAIFTSADPAVATVAASGLMTGVAEGSATIVASLTHESVTHADSSVVSVSASAPPGSAMVTTPGVSFDPSTVTIAAGGTVTWQVSGARHNVTFIDAVPPGGNLPDTDPGGSGSRTFPQPGSYPYVCTRHDGMSGRVIVQ